MWLMRGFRVPPLRTSTVALNVFIALVVTNKHVVCCDVGLVHMVCVYCNIGLVLHISIASLRDKASALS